MGLFLRTVCAHPARLNLIRAFLACLVALLSLSLAQARDGAERRASDAVCTQCHDEMEGRPILSLYQTRHGVHADRRTPACQDCHGASLAHVNSGKKALHLPLTERPFSAKQPAGKQNEACLNCHQSNVARHWQGSQHERQGLACTACHTIHLPRDPALNAAEQSKSCFSCHPTVRMQQHLPSSHPVGNGKLQCSACHNPHGSDGPRLLREDSVVDTCLSCHAEKRGPFLWEHAPVSEDCTLCHTAHGAIQRPLLKQRSPWLCQQCHSSARHPATAYSATTGANTSLSASLANSAQLPLHGCSNCHSQVHGSNHPGGARLLR